MSDIYSFEDIFSSIILCMLTVAMSALIIGIVLLVFYLSYQLLKTIFFYIKRKFATKNKRKDFKSSRTSKSVWPHLLALIQDGYLSNAEALVHHYEHEIDELRKKLYQTQLDLDNLKNRYTSSK